MYPFKRKVEVDGLLQQNKLYVSDSVILSQSVKHSPFRVIAKGSNKKTGHEKSTAIPIWDENQQYTGEFIKLLKDYYLYL